MKSISKVLLVIALSAVFNYSQKPNTPVKVPPSIVPIKTTAKPALQKTYTSETYGFKLTFPKVWVLPDEYLDQNILQSGYDLRAEPTTATNSPAQFEIGQNINRVKVLLTAYRPTTKTQKRLVLRVSAEDLSLLPQVKDAVDYFDLMRLNFKMINLPADFKYSETQAEKLGKKQFAFLDTSSNSGKKRLYATVRNGYALMFTLTYKDNADVEALRQILSDGDFALKK